MAGTDETRTERFDRYIRKSPPALIAGLVLFLLITGFALVGYAHDGYRWWDRRTHWRDHEYDKLAQLHSDLTEATFERVLGPPLIERREARKWDIRVFGGRDYWVKTVSRPGSNTVALYAVTSCSATFTPTFRLSGIGTVTLHRSRLTDHRSRAQNFRSWILADGPPSFFVSTYASHINNYKGFGWGDGGSCNDPVPHDLNLYRLKPRTTIGHMPLRFASKLVVNTYAEWGPSELDWPRNVWFGVDEVDINIIAGRCVTGCLGNLDTGDG